MPVDDDTASGLTKDSRPYQVYKHRHILHNSEAPADAPKLNVRWHYAVDIPKRRVYPEKNPSKIKKEPGQFMAFGKKDSNNLERVWQTAKDDEAIPAVAVNEDHLFQVNLEERELGPIYWRGPTYEIRRGTWHFADGNIQKPCEENLATQLEDGYLKIKPFRDRPPATEPTSEDAEREAKETLTDVSKISRQLATAGNTNSDIDKPDKIDDVGKKDPEKKTANSDVKRDAQKDHMIPLFGAYAGKYVLYTSKQTAWLLSDDLYGKISASFFQSVTRGLHMGGQKLRRGYVERTAKKPSEIDIKDSPGKKERSDTSTSPVVSEEAKEADVGTGMAPEAEEDDTDSLTDNPDRKIDHLILCCHGIGQKLGERLEAVNFVHDVNVLRRIIKKTFGQSRDLQTLSSDKHNSGIQVLPVEWRQSIQFGMSKDYDGPTSSKDEQDLSTMPEDDDEHATLQDITVEGVQTIRNLVSDVLLDVLLYYQPSYREQIVKAVSKEMNRVVKLFRERNPSFDGKVSILGHSLGSAIAFDILCRQPTDPGECDIPTENHLDPALSLDFECENFYAVGSPIGLFQMLRGKNIAARSLLKNEELPFSPLGPRDNPFEGPPISFPKARNMYNIFHPSDPVSYRVEPLISKHAAKLRPYPIPYTKSGLRQQLVGLSSIPQRAYEGASSYLGAITSSITNSIVSRSLGYGDLGASPMKNDVEDQKRKITKEFTKQHEETLFAGFERAWGSNHIKKLEGEQKLRAMNRSGRVDFALQEDMFGSSYVSAISAHLAYWGDSDLAHFILSYSLIHENSPTPRRQESGTVTPLKPAPRRLDTNL